MKIEFKRHYIGANHLYSVTLCCGGLSLVSMSESELKRIDWKNATEAEFACARELREWIAECKPGQWTREEVEAWPLATNEIISMVEKRTREIVAFEQAQEAGK